MVMNHEHKILLVKGYIRGWEFPGGFVQDGEAIKAAAIREVKEESGINVRIIKFLGIERDVGRSTIVFLFEGKPVSGTFATSLETEDAGYFAYDEAIGRISLQSFKDRMNRCLNKDAIPFVIEK